MERKSFHSWNTGQKFDVASKYETKERLQPRGMKLWKLVKRLLKVVLR